MSRIRNRYPAGIPPLMISSRMALKTRSVISEGPSSFDIATPANVNAGLPLAPRPGE
jgi:hypothetical protein